MCIETAFLPGGSVYVARLRLDEVRCVCLGAFDLTRSSKRFPDLFLNLLKAEAATLGEIGARTFLSASLKAQRLKDGCTPACTLAVTFGDEGRFSSALLQRPDGQ